MITTDTILVSNIVGAMSGITGSKRDIIINLQLCRFFRADMKLGTAVAKGVGVDIDSVMKDLNH